MTRPKKGKSGTSTGTRPPYWFEARVPARFDIALLKPRSLPRDERFETVAHVEERSRVLELALRRSPHRMYRDLAEILSDCRNGYYICGRPFCPICARQYRHWFIAEVLRHAAAYPDRAFALTVYLQEVDANHLGGADISRLHAMLRARLRRCGFVGSMVIGGTEVAYRARTGRWLLHVHLLALGVPHGAIEKLAASFGRKGRKFEAQELRDSVKQLSYVQKFATYHRPGKQTSNRKPRPYPLPNSQLLELTEWSSQYQFDDFLFLFGARRRGKRIVRERQ
jgi:hypothetical protein